jgi:hypothetical protein
MDTSNEEKTAHECKHHHHNHEACHEGEKNTDMNVASEKQDAEKQSCSHSCCGDKDEGSATPSIKKCSCK